MTSGLNRYGSFRASSSSPFHHETGRSILIMCILAFLNNAGYMALISSLIFYVREVGGNEDQYGRILAANNLAAFLAMPIYGRWVDTSGNQYRTPFLVGIVLAIVGSLLYTSAILWDGRLAVGVLIASRLVYGIGSAYGCTGVAYIVSVTEPDQVGIRTLIVSVCGFWGLAFGAFLNLFLSSAEGTLELFGLATIPIDPNNAVGLLMAAFDTIGFLLVYHFIAEPEKNTDDSANDKFADNDRWWGYGAVVRASMSDIRLFLPLLTYFVAALNYQSIETAVVPAAAHALGWGAVEISALLGFSSILLLCAAFVGMHLSATYNISDSTMIMVGNLLWAVAGLMMVRPRMRASARKLNDRGILVLYWLQDIILSVVCRDSYLPLPCLFSSHNF